MGPGAALNALARSRLATARAFHLPRYQVRTYRRRLPDPDAELRATIAAELAAMRRTANL